ncbi:MAG: bifunctional aspartate kinase/homoserine dehydrogenase I [Ignavibacteria bacterium]|jgi:aspartokinase/homoserine dehydrogenase 1
MKVLKFGGSSVGTPDRIKKVINILKDYSSQGIEFCVVFSAFQGVTDELLSISEKALANNSSYYTDLSKLRKRHLDCIKQLLPDDESQSIKNFVLNLFEELKDILQSVYLLRELTKKTQDHIVSFGERLSCSIINVALNSSGIKSNFLDSRDIVITDSNYGYAKIDIKKTYTNIRQYFDANKGVQVVTGFIGKDKKGFTTTIGRGGSDLTASILGAALKANIIEIWTDVDGILTADPRKVPNAFSVKAVTFEEAMELSHFGAKVIYPPTMQPALEKKIKIVIKNTFNLDFKGTLILEKEKEVPFNVKGISSIDDVSLITVSGSGMIGVPGIASRLFNCLAQKNISIILITQASSEHTICFAVLPQYGIEAKETIEEEFKYEIKDRIINKVKLEDELSIIAVVGEDLKRTHGVSGKVVESLGKNGINIVAIAQGSSELNISLVINKKHLRKALNVLHDSVFLSNKIVLNLFIVGPGLVGSELIKRLDERKKYSEEELNVKYKLVGLANSKKMIIDEEGIDLAEWSKVLKKAKGKSDIKKFIGKIVDLNLPNNILVDCTGNETVIPYYHDLLKSSISIVTPNKIANTKDYSFYKDLRKEAKKNNTVFRYGTNVGAALPIIRTLKDLIASGDEIIKIEGVLSGTLSYLFNEFKNENDFSKIIIDAKSKGYTEPDPRDDLNGLDVARKLLILIREAGIKMELSDIATENLIPKELKKYKDISDFIKNIKEIDKRYASLKNKAAKQDKVLCYIAKYENKKAKVGIEFIGKDHPFFELKGNDNIVAFTTANYSEKPLVIKGPGAGAGFTASGVFADILRVSNYLG